MELRAQNILYHIIFLHHLHHDEALRTNKGEGKGMEAWGVLLRGVIGRRACICGHRRWEQDDFLRGLVDILYRIGICLRCTAALASPTDHGTNGD